MEQMKIGPVASYLEKVALAMDDGGLTPEDNRYIGLEDTAKEAISHLLTAMFPHYLGSLRDRFVSAEKRTWELMRAFDALSSALRCVINCRKQADIKAAELIQSLPDILDVLRTDIQAAYEGTRPPPPPTRSSSPTPSLRPSASTASPTSCTR